MGKALPISSRTIVTKSPAHDAAFLQRMANLVPGLIAVYNLHSGVYWYVNDAVEKLLGYTPEEFLAGGLSFATSLVHEEDLSLIMEQNAQALRYANQSTVLPGGEPIVRFEYRMRHKDGSYRWLNTTGSVFSRDKHGLVENVLNISIDITDRKQVEARLEQLTKELAERAENNLKKSEAYFRSLIEAVEDYAFFALDPSGNITSWNEGVGTILGYNQNEIVGVHFRELFSPQDKAAGLPEQALALVQQRGDCVHEGLRVRKDGSTFHAVATLTAIKADDAVTGYSVILRDITEKKEAEETIRYQAFHDMLTGLPNREALYERFAIAESGADRHGSKLAVLFLDLDRFKIINDTLGHAVGDQVLKEVADRLTRAVRKHDTVARLGGDEFILLLTEIQSLQDCAHICQKIQATLESVIRVQNHSLHVSASIGVVLFPDDGDSIHALLKNADTALYRAKEAGKNRFQFYNYSMNLASVERLSLEQDLRGAVSRNQLELVYQPFVQITTGKVAGVEALVRWRHPVHGLLYPTDFIPLAEETGLIHSIGNWILTSVCTEGRRLHESGFPLTVSMNLSPRQFSEERIVTSITSVLNKTKFPPKFLELEITESMAMENVARTSGKLVELKQHGIALVIDDFGTGYSSLSYLKRFPVHKLKIDKSFVKHAISDAQDLAIVRAIISMATNMGLKVCAEGIEQEAQLQLLGSLDCSMAQGYFISTPLSPDKLLAWMRNKELIKPTAV